MNLEDLKFAAFIAIAVVIVLLYSSTKIRRGIDLHRAEEPSRVSWIMRRPLWVKMGLLHVGSRQTAVNFVRYSIISAFVCVFPAAYYAFSTPILFLPSVLLLLAAVWYWQCIKWVDRHGAWPQDA